MANDKTNIKVHRSNGNVVLEKNAQSIVDRKENQFRNSKYSKKYKKAYKQRQEKISRISRPYDEKGKSRAFVDNRKDRRKKKQRSATEEEEFRRLSPPFVVTDLHSGENNVSFSWIGIAL